MPTSDPHVPELLAPAGSMAALRAAVAAGADAVYLGVDQLNARRGAENFTRETLAEACRFAHLYGVKVYLTANVVVLPNEFETALTLIDDSWVAGVDAVIVQDLGLLSAVRQTMPEVRLHASTQIDAHSSDTVRALAALGVARITLARETAFAEIAQLVRVGAAEGVEVESFAHGALCICYSGQCLLSSLIGGRSANRGLCAQPCRLPYELVDEADRTLSDVGAHLLSPKDLASISVLPELVATGVAALKLEGRMKSPEYVGLVTGVYRGALDRALQVGDAYEVRDGEMSVLSEAFSRGFTEAYLTGERGNDMMSYRRPNNRGVPVGRVSAVEGRSATISLDVPVDSQDTIEVWTSKGRFAQPLGSLAYDGATHTSAPAGARVVVLFEDQATAGDRVFRVRNAALSAAAGRLFDDPHGPGLDLDFAVDLVVGEPSSVRVSDDAGHSGLSSGSIVESARTRAVTAEEVAEHVGRLGGTPYRPRAWDIALSPHAGFGFSELHRLRREALARYEEAVLSEWLDRKPVRPTPPRLDRAQIPERVEVVANASDLDVASACLEAGADRAIVPAWALPAGTAVPAGIVPAVPRVCHDQESAGLYAAPVAAGRGVAGTLGSLSALADAGLELEADWSLNALNAHTVATLAGLGAGLVWLSPELSAGQIREVASSARVPVGVGVAGRQELMVTEHCVLMAEGPCGQNCPSCARRRGTRYLKDRKGYRFPVVTDPSGRTHVYNSVPLDLVASLADVLSTGVSALRVDVETEDAARAAALVRRVREALEASVRGRSVPKPPTPVTSGHFFRGVS